MSAPDKKSVDTKANSSSALLEAVENVDVVTLLLALGWSAETFASRNPTAPSADWTATTANNEIATAYWPALRRSLLLRVESLGIQMRSLLARAKLTAAAERPELVDACAGSLSEHEDRAMAGFAAAEQSFAAAGMLLHEYLARRCRGLLTRGDEGHALVQCAETAIRARRRRRKLSMRPPEPRSHGVRPRSCPDRTTGRWPVRFLTRTLGGRWFACSEVESPYILLGMSDRSPCIGQIARGY